MESITITGRLGADAQIKHSDRTGNDFITVSLASNKRINGDSVTTWWDVVLSNTKRYEKMVQYLKKGTGVVVVGEPHVSLFEGRDGQTRANFSVYADKIDFLSDGNGQTKTEGQKATTETPKKAATKAKKVEDEPEEIPMMRKSETEVSDDDLPF